jgi:transposase
LKKARVHLDYHVEVEGHYYSVPYQYARQQIDLRLSEHTLECFFRGRRIASHRRSLRKGRHTTVKAHMPASHRHYADWTEERLLEEAAKIGQATAELFREIIASRAHPQQGYRSCLGILRLGEAHGQQRLEHAARRALVIGARSYKSVASILKHGLETRPLPEEAQPEQPLQHENIRGGAYYSNEPHHLLHPNQRYEC